MDKKSYRHQIGDQVLVNIMRKNSQTIKAMKHQPEFIGSKSSLLKAKALFQMGEWASLRGSCFSCSGLGVLSVDPTKRWNIHDLKWSLHRRKVVSLRIGETPLFFDMFGFFGTVMVSEV